MPSSKNILVTDGEHRAALAVTRSLGRAGYRVIVASPRERTIAGASRFAARSVVTPDPLGDPTAFVASLRARCDEEGVNVLIPISDQSMGPVLDARPTFSGVAIPFPDREAYRRISDKGLVLEEGASLGIRVPSQVVLNGPPTPRELEAVGFPAVIKPARSVIKTPATQFKLSVRHSASRAQLEAALALLPDSAYPILLQQRVVGPGLGVFVLMANGSPLAAFGHRRILERPPSGGVSACAESVAVDPELLRRSVELLRRFAWEGVAMVEFKRDSATGEPFLMEVNGRFWGSLQLAIDSGVDFPRLLVEHTLGREVKPVLSWTEGVRCRWRLGEVDHFLARIRRSGKALSLPPDAPSLASAFAHAVLPGIGPKGRGEVCRVDDPMPQLVELMDWVRGR
jgi:predicted ATP-grasp superfamily ATP-dependent carboligase